MRTFFFSLTCVAPYVCLHAKEIWESLAAVGISPSKVEHWTGIDRRQFARQLEGAEKLDFNTLDKFPLSFAREFYWRMVLKVGLPEAVRKSLPLLLAYERPMVKMSLPEEQKERIA